MLRILRVSALVLALSLNATAGEIQYGATEPPPPPPDEQTVMTNSTQTGDGQESSTTGELQAIINLLGYLLPLI